MATRQRFLIDGQQRTISLDTSGDQVRVQIDDTESVDGAIISAAVPGAVTLDFGTGRQLRAYVARVLGGFEIFIEGQRFRVEPVRGGRGRTASGGAGDPVGKVTAPLAGVVVAVRVEVGQQFETGQPLLVVEAMKMQNEVSAQHSGRVTAIHYEQGARVEAGALLLEYDVIEA